MDHLLSKDVILGNEFSLVSRSCHQPPKAATNLQRYKRPHRLQPVGPFHFPFTRSPMDELLLLLRCPIDPKREATLTRDGQSLVCSGCAVHFPVKHGLPVLISDEARLPPSVRSRDHLPCVRATGRES